MNQSELQSLALERILDAEVLIQGGRWAFAYYVSGYAAECALKSWVLSRMIHTGWVFQDKARISDCLTHDFGELVNLAGLNGELNAQLAANSSFVHNWTIVMRWKVTSRYGQTVEAEAINLFQAISDDPNGVMKWIVKYW